MSKYTSYVHKYLYDKYIVMNVTQTCMDMDNVTYIHIKINKLNEKN